MRSKHPDETRRRLMAGAGAAGVLAGMNGLLPAWARPLAQTAAASRAPRTGSVDLGRSAHAIHSPGARPTPIP